MVNKKKQRPILLDVLRWAFPTDGAVQGVIVAKEPYVLYCLRLGYRRPLLSNTYGKAPVVTRCTIPRTIITPINIMSDLVTTGIRR